MTEQGSGHLKTQENQFVKQHIEYDISGRAEYIYTVYAEAADGTPCSVVRYAYDGITSRVLYMKEYQSNWDASWEVF